jgi:sugar lactone lactonase YvrE
MQIVPVPGFGTEDVLVAESGPDEGAVWTGTEDGSIWRVRHDGRRIDLVARTGGRPLGIERWPDGRLLVCDSRGLLRVDPGTGEVEVLVGEVEGVPMRFCNNAAVADDGTVWFTDSSRHYGIDRWRDEMAMNTRSGRLLRRDPDGSVEVMADGLRFANGVALAADTSYVVVAETAACRLTRWWLSGERAGDKDLFVATLPGYPDNISRGGDGLVWTTIASPVDPLVERIQHGPHWLRVAATRVPAPLQPGERRTVRAQAYDAAGGLVHDLDLPADGFHMATGVRQHDGRVWLSSLREPTLAVASLQAPQG